MKTPIKIAMIGTLGLLTSATVFAQPQAGDDASPADPPRSRPGMNRPDPEAHRKVLLEKYDADKNGELDDAELTALGRDVFEGKLPPPGRGRGGQGERGGPGFGPARHGGHDGSELRPPNPRGPRGEGERGFGPRGPRQGDGPGLRPDRMMDRRDFDGGRGPGRPSFDPGLRGFGRPDSEEIKKIMEDHRREFLKKYDANKDGKLDAAEREAIGRDIEDGKLPPPPLPPSARRDSSPREQ